MPDYDYYIHSFRVPDSAILVASVPLVQRGLGSLRAGFRDQQ